jgi:hypothetical protein
MEKVWVANRITLETLSVRFSVKQTQATPTVQQSVQQFGSPSCRVVA